MRLPLLILIMILAAPGCSRSKPEAEFSCENLQHRALSCEQDALELIKRRMKESAADASGPELDRQYAMLERRFRQRLQSGGTRKQCEKFSVPEEAARVERMKDCYARSGCALFAGCMLELER